MWTPKRVLLLSVGTAVFIAGYLVYAMFLGWIDGLSQLPEAFLPGPIDIEKLRLSDESDLDRKLQDAFGKQCPQIKQRMKFEIRKKGLVIAASDALFNEPDGRVKLPDFSVALFKNHADDKFPEITTITADIAFLRFEDNITSPMDMNKSKIAQGELRGHVCIINNHRTPEAFDDLEVLVDNEPLFYDESKGLIWTDGFVKLIDKQTQPHPTKISGHGMELHLAKEQPKENKPAAAPLKGKSDLNGVDKIMLKSMVEMHIFTDANSGFMNGTAKPTPPVKQQQQQRPLDNPFFLPTTDLIDTKAVAKSPASPTQKSHVVITTNGQFVYEMAHDIARFDSPPFNPQSGFPDQVEVLREPMPNKADEKADGPQDRLYCDLLILKFRRKLEPVGPRGLDQTPPGGEKEKASTGSDREIESAHATANPGMEVVLSLESENLACHCEELIYVCATPKRGARTELRGSPLEAIKDAHKIKSQKLTLESADQKGAGQRIVAEGPGQVDLYDRNPGKGYTTHAIWKGLLTSKKFTEAGRDLDQLTLTRDAVFIDDEHGQKLYGQILQVWLEPTEAPSNATPADQKRDATNAGPRQLPRKVDAFDQVSAESPDLRVNQCNHLTIRFKDIVRSANTLPGTIAPQTPGAQSPGGQVGPPPLPGAAPSSSQTKEKEKEKPKRPIDLRARDVIVDVLRGGDKNELQEVLATGSVYVRQDGEKPGDKGVDIKGDLLHLVHFMEGDVLKVEANEPRKAELQLGDLYLMGPKVTIDQRDNIAEVKGGGAMRMPSNATFEGGKPTKPGTILTVHFKQDMLFTGRDADFNGGVFAYQDNSKLLCQQLQVTLDRPVSLKEGQKGDQAAKVEKVIAYDKVAVEDIEKGKKDELIGHRVLYSKSLTIDNHDKQGNGQGENQANAVGPGTLLILALDSGDDASPLSMPKQPQKDSAKAPRPMLTHVDFEQRMLSSQFNGVRKSTFNGKILVYHVPTDNVYAQVEYDKLPPGGMVLSCDVLTVIETVIKGKKSQELEAKGRAQCWTDDHKYFLADIITFNQTTDTVTFTGSPGNPAKVYQRSGGPGSPFQWRDGQKIMFNRKTNELRIDGSSGFSGEMRPEDRLRPLEVFIVAKL